MQIVIDIPDQMYQKIKETNMIISGRRSGERFDYILFNAVNTGTPLPKGHGRLIDADELKKHKYHDNDRYENAVAVAQIDWADTIIEADEGE